MQNLRFESERRGMTMTKIIERALDAQFSAQSGNVVNLRDHLPDDADGL